MFELFEHTADIGLRVRAADLPELFRDAARALFSVMVANLDEVRPVQDVALRIEAGQLDDLLHDWLAELLYTFDARHLVLSAFEVNVEPPCLTAVARGEPLDPQRHHLGMEVKAITYHGLKLEHQDGDWLAEVIMDI
jgi:SHS2 domain-containing protein